MTNKKPSAARQCGQKHCVCKKSVCLYAALLACAVLFLLSLLFSYGDYVRGYYAAPPAPPAAQQQSAPARGPRELAPRPTEFVYQNPAAKKVFLAIAGQEVALAKTAPGKFSKTLVLPSGEYQYHFIVDGAPQAPAAKKVL